jgi:hypothetical protein
MIQRTMVMLRIMRSVVKTISTLFCGMYSPTRPFTVT